MNQLAYSLNIAMALCEIGVGLECLASVTSAQEALVRAEAVSRKAGQWSIDDAAYGAICEALVVHDAQLELATQAQIAEAEKILKGRVAEGQIIRVQVAAEH